MKYRLKDRAMQAKLDALSGGDFSLKLQEQVTPYKLTLTFVEVGFSRKKGKNTRWFTATFRTDEIEKVPEYDPNQWNLYPEVTPPQGAMMRIKYHDTTSEDRKVERGFAIFDCGQWVNDSGYPKFPNPQNYVVWFRPWIGPDEEGSK